MIRRIKNFFQNIQWINSIYIKWKWKERMVSYGKENPDKTFFVVRRAACKVGLFSYVMTNMGLVHYAIQKGYIPVIDMQNVENTYLEPEKIGKENAWEFYFKQPMGYDLTHIAKSKKIILSSGLITKENYFPDMSIAYDKKTLNEWKKVFQKYLRINESLLAEFECERKKMFGDLRVIGVLARGTDYINARPPKHPVQPTIQQIIEKTEESFNKNKCQIIYLATEDQSIFLKLKKRFGDKLVSIETNRYSTIGNENINDVQNDRDESRYLRGKKYLLSIWLLSQCDCLVAGNVGGTQGALLMNTSYEDNYIFNLGVY